MFLLVSLMHTRAAGISHNSCAVAETCIPRQNVLTSLASFDNKALSLWPAMGAAALACPFTCPCFCVVNSICAPERLKDHDPSIDPIIVLGCGHAYTLTTLDGLLGLKSAYAKVSLSTRKRRYTIQAVWV